VHFLIDACLPLEFAPPLRRYGHTATDVRGIGMRKADDAEIAAYARTNRLCLLTEDWGFADIRVYPPDQHHGLVVFDTGYNSIEEKLAALQNLLEHRDIIPSLPGRLAIVTSKRVRLRPPID
jgi:predicted nuclease of predicted toxin-antitoxin system